MGQCGCVQVPAEAKWHHHNRYSAQAACRQCGGIVRHERWCPARSCVVAYAYRVVEDATALREADRLALHALGVVWE